MVLVTGGTGLVGSHLLLRLVMDNYPVRALYRTPKKLAKVKRTFAYYTQDAQRLFEKIDWIEGDILDLPSLEIVFQHVTKVYHCAALISFSPSDFKKLERINREGTSNIVNMCISERVEKLCYVSTIGTIGRTITDEKADEETEWNRQNANPYAITKYLAEMEVWRGAQEHLKVVIVNPGVILGPGYWKSGSGTFFKTASKGYAYYPPGGSGFISVTDVVRIMVHLMNADVNGERFITVAKNISYKDILGKIAIALHKKPPHKKLKLWQLQIGRYVDYLNHAFTGKPRTITDSTIYGLRHPISFDGGKLQRVFEFEFESLDTVIAMSAKLFIEEHS